MKTFSELGLNDALLRAIAEQGYENPMPVQEEVIPWLTDTQSDNQHSDLIALAQTGTGKTAAYGLPLLHLLAAEGHQGDRKQVRALILAPTRELCIQITEDLHDFAHYLPDISMLAVYGGAGIEPQIRALKHGVDIVVATPGRLIDLMNRGVADLSQVSSVILDEADEMLSMGFQDDLNSILEGVPADHRTLLFSATMSKEIERIAKKYLRDAHQIQVGSRNEGSENVNHIYYMVRAKDKYAALKRVVDYFPRIYAIIFCRTKAETQEVADNLIRDGYNADALHGDLSQQQRDLTMQKFRQHTVQLLVATDVAARGLDVDDLTHVINYGLPDDVENYTHRSGRTGRAGKKGTSICIIHTREQFKVRNIEKIIGKEFVEGTLPTPEEICKKQLYKVMDDIMKTDVDEELIAPYMPDIMRQFEYIDKEDIMQKVVSITFGRFLNYYKNAPEIVRPTSKRGEKGDRKSQRDGRGGATRQRGPRKAEEGYRRLFINLGKQDGFYPGEIMQFMNHHIHGPKQTIGHIDLLQKFAYIEVPTDDAEKVMRALNGVSYKGREVRCNDADEGGHGRAAEGGRGRGAADGDTRGRGDARKGRERNRRDDRYDERRGDRRDTSRGRKPQSPFGDENQRHSRDDWKSLMNGQSFKLKGEEPDFSEEGWARRRPKK